VLIWERCRLETSVGHVYLVIDVTPGSRKVPPWHADTHPKVLYYVRQYLSCQMWELFPVTYVLQNNNILYFHWDVAIELAVIKHILGNQNDTDIPKMAAIRK